MKAIIQARLTSQRFPGKVLSWINGRTLLGNIIERLQRCNTIDGIYLAIPMERENRELFDLEKFYQITVFDVSGENDVVGRFGAVCDFYHIGDFVRVCGDSPFIQPWVIDYAVDRFFMSNCHYLVTEGMPDGMNAEVINYSALKEAYPKMTAEEKEHVTLYFDNHPDEFVCKKLDLKHMSIDTVEDLTRLRGVAKYAV